MRPLSKLIHEADVSGGFRAMNWRSLVQRTLFFRHLSTLGSRLLEEHPCRLARKSNPRRVLLAGGFEEPPCFIDGDVENRLPVGVR